MNPAERQAVRRYRERLALPGEEELAAPAADSSFTVVDLETTGGKPPEHRIIEVGAVRIENLQPTETFSSLVNPDRPLPPFIQQLTGITPRMLDSAPSSPRVLPELLDFIGDDVVVAHNAPFDLKFINRELTGAGYDPVVNPDLCSCRLARNLLPEMPSKSLGDLAEALGLHVPERHRALGDARATADLTALLVTDLIRRGHRELEDILAAQYRLASRPLPNKPSLRALRDRRVMIREYNSEDLPLIFRWFSDSGLWRRWYPDTPGPDFHKLRSDIQRTAYRDKLFIVERRGVPAGLVALSDLELDGSHRGELRLAIAEDEYRGRGLGVHALSKVLNYCFEFLALDYVNTRVNPELAGLMRIAERFGFEPNPHSHKPDSAGQVLLRLTRESWDRTLAAIPVPRAAAPSRTAS